MCRIGMPMLRPCKGAPSPVSRLLCRAVEPFDIFRSRKRYRKAPRNLIFPTADSESKNRAMMSVMGMFRQLKTEWQGMLYGTGVTQCFGFAQLSSTLRS